MASHCTTTSRYGPRGGTGLPRGVPLAWGPPWPPPLSPLPLLQNSHSSASAAHERLVYGPCTFSLRLKLVHPFAPKPIAHSWGHSHLGPQHPAHLLLGEWMGWEFQTLESEKTQDLPYLGAGLQNHPVILLLSLSLRLMSPGSLECSSSHYESHLSLRFIMAVAVREAVQSDSSRNRSCCWESSFGFSAYSLCDRKQLS